MWYLHKSKNDIENREQNNGFKRGKVLIYNNRNITKQIGKIIFKKHLTIYKTNHRKKI